MALGIPQRQKMRPSWTPWKARAHRRWAWSAPRLEVLEDRTLPSISGLPFKVDHFGGNPRQSASASDAVGDTLVVWTSDDVSASTSSIKGRLFDEIGNYKTSEFPVQFGTLDGPISEPAVAMDGKGDFVVTWTETDPSFIKSVWFRRGGLNTGGGLQLGSTVTEIGDGSESRVGMDSNGQGDFVVSYTNSGVGGVRVARYYKDGTLFKEFTASNGVLTPPQSATATELLFTPIVTVTVVSTAGYATGDTVVISGMTPAAYNGTFTISSVPSGTKFIYTDPTVDLADGAGGTAQDLTAHPYSHTSSIAVAPGGGFALAFETYFPTTGNSNVFLQQYDNQDALQHSQQFGSPDPHDGTQTSPSVAVDDQGDPVLVFQNHAYQDYTNWNLVAEEGLRDGDLGMLTFIVTGDPSGGDLTAAVAADPGPGPPGFPNYIVAYKRHPSTGGSQVWATEVTSASATPTSTEIDLAQDGSAVGVSVNAEHRFLVTYNTQPNAMDMRPSELNGQFGQLGGLAGSPVFLSLATHVLTATGDGSPVNTITIFNDGGDMGVIVNHRLFDLQWHDAAGGVYLNGDKNQYTFNIGDVEDGTAITVNTGTSIDVVHVENLASLNPDEQPLASFDGSLTVNGQGGADSLEVVDRPPNPNTYNLQAGLLTSPNLPTFSIRYSNMGHVSLTVTGNVNVKGPNPIATVDAAITDIGTADSVVVDFTAGNPIPANVGGLVRGLYVDAGGGALNLVGDAFIFETAFETSPKSGMIGLSPASNPPSIFDLRYANVTSITDPASGLTVQSGSAGDTFTVTGAPVDGLGLGSSKGSSNVVNVLATGPGRVSLISEGRDTVNVGNAGRVQSIASDVLLGGSGSIALTVDDSADTGNHKTVLVGAHTLTGLAPATIAYSSLASLTVRGGLGNDTVRLATGLPKANIFISELGGTNTLVAPNSVNTWLLNAFNGGRLNQAITFANFQNLVGGSMSDTFRFAPAGSLTGTINGGGGHDWLDYSLLTTPVSVNLATGSATGVGGGAAGRVFQIQNVVGGAGNDTLVGDAQGNILIGGSATNVITGGSGGSLLIGGPGRATITGGSADDILIAGTTTFDANEAALMAILQEWQRTDKTYAQRIGDLRNGGGFNGANKLVWGTTVLDNDTAGATLTGGAGQDWFFANLARDVTDSGVLDKVTDLSAKEFAADLEFINSSL